MADFIDEPSEGVTEEVIDGGIIYPVGDNGYPLLDGLVLTAEHQAQLVDEFLANQYGAAYLSRKLAIAHAANLESIGE